MNVGDRIKERLAQVGISQSELARRVGLTQPAINALIRGSSRTSLHLHRIAAELGTTPAYLEGTTDDPDENAPPPPAALRVQFVRMDVALPSTNALAEMFEGLLLAVPPDLSTVELARELAELLPTGLSQLRGLLPATAAGEAERPKAAAAALATDDHEPQP